MALPSSCNSSVCASQIFAKHQGICPSGWHIPSNEDWGALMQYINPSCSLDSYYCEGAGTKLKATNGWNDNSNGTDNYGFAALPGGYGSSGGNFYGVGSDGFWWSASESNANYTYRWNMTNLSYQNENVNRSCCDSKSDFLVSVRCLQD